MPETTALPIRRVTFFKHGVSLLEREGKLDGDRLPLQFRAGDIDDALKSLTVLDRAGGRIVCVDYDIPAGAFSDSQGLPWGRGAGAGSHWRADRAPRCRVQPASTAASARGARRWHAVPQGEPSHQGLQSHADG